MITTITPPVVLVFAAPSLLGIVLVGFVVLIGCHLLLSPVLAALVLTLTLATVLLPGYMGTNREHLSATATSSAHFEPPGHYELEVQSTSCWPKRCCLIILEEIFCSERIEKILRRVNSGEYRRVSLNERQGAIFANIPAFKQIDGLSADKKTV